MKSYILREATGRAKPAEGQVFDEACLARPRAAGLRTREKVEEDIVRDDEVMAVRGGRQQLMLEAV